jgi:RHS repeat-associated protein
VAAQPRSSQQRCRQARSAEDESGGARRRAGATPRAPARGGITIDALNRVTSISTPDDSLLEPLYNEASLLETLSVYLRGATTATPIIKDLDYNAKGQRTRIQYAQTPGSGSAPFATEYQYDELTFRLKRLTTTRVSPSNTLQDLRYEFDPVGNTIRIQDDAQQSLFYDDAFVAPENLYTYDPLYRLVQATGREHASIGTTQLDHNDQPIRNLPLPTDPSAVRSYQEQYTYDLVGNLLELFHSAGGGANTWTRTCAYISGTNRLASNTIPGGSATYTHDAHGSITSMPHLAAIAYGPFDQMQSADLGGGGDAYYQYDASGQRVRKLIDTGANLIKERIYLGAYEIYREHISGDIDLERQSLHVMDGTRRVALLETLTIEDGNPVTTPVTHQRFQLGNHLDSALLEVDETGLIISYEEYAPYGTSAYRSAKSGVEVSARRYRYTGKERDDETGLYYYGARYYAAWLGRWTSADPLGIGADGPGLYNYVRGAPVTLTDPNGAEGKDPNEQGWWRRGLQAIAKPLFQATYAPASLLNAAELAGVVDQGTTQAAAEMYVGAGVRAVEQAKAAANPIGTAIETVTRLNQSVEQKGVTQTVRDASPFGNADRASDALSRNDYLEAGKELFDIAMFITGVTKSVASARPAKINLPPPPAVVVGPELALAGASVAHVPAAIVALGQIAAMSVASGSGGDDDAKFKSTGRKELGPANDSRAPRVAVDAANVRKIKSGRGKGNDIEVETQREAEATLRAARPDLPWNETYAEPRPKFGAEVHPPDGSGVDLPHIKWRDWRGGKSSGAEGHIYFKRP